ncbi:hypothetical protein E5D57_007477 [Metarhizium anisopliae]|nr:hypothetical protein E5D57_007477 [Metarhizium anisopliae]
MAADNVATLDPRLFDEDDNAEDLSYKQIINSLLTQKASPVQAAARIDDWVVGETNRRYNELKQREPPFSLTDEEKDSIYLVGPNPSRQISMIVGAIARVCSAYPPGHPVQDALVGLFQALKAMPKHEVPDLSYDEESNEPSFERKLALWPFGTPSVEYLAQKFQREAEELAYPFSEVETQGSEFQLRWKNLQGFISRLTSLDLIDCSIASALGYILPTHYAYPDLNKRPQGGPNRIEADLIAAAQWLEPDQPRQWVYNQCRSTAVGDGMRQIWNMDKWNLFKEQLSFFSSDERFSQDARRLAKSLREKMETQG